MEVLKDYPKEFAELFLLSFDCLLKLNLKFLAGEGLVEKYCRYLYIIPCLVLSYVTMGWNLKLVLDGGDIFEFANLVPPFLICTQAHLKTIALTPKVPLISNVIRDLATLWRTTGLSQAQINARDSLLKGISVFDKVIYWMSVAGTSHYLMMSLVETLVRRFVLRQDSELLLPLKCAYPFDPTASWPVYLAVYGFQAYSMYLCVCVYVGAEYIMITLCGILGVEFSLLCEDLLQVAPTRTKSRDDEVLTDDNGKEWTLKQVIKRHQKLCVLSKQIDKAFNQVIFIDLLFVGLTICFFSFAAQFSRGPSYMINNYVGILSCLMHTFRMCYYGEILTRASVRIGDMAYHSKWYDGDNQHRKIILFMIMRTRKPCSLTSMKYTPVTLNLFTKVMSNTWSYLSLMNTVYKED